MTLGEQPEAEEIIATLLAMMSQLKSKSTIAQEMLAKKMATMLSVYDLCTVQRGLEILGIAVGSWEEFSFNGLRGFL